MVRAPTCPLLDETRACPAAARSGTAPEVTRADQLITVTVLNALPADNPICTAIYGRVDDQFREGFPIRNELLGERQRQEDHLRRTIAERCTFTRAGRTPEVVTFEDNRIDARGVDYQRLVAVLIEAMKEQQKDISAMQAENTTLLNEHKKVEELERKLAQQQKDFTARLKEQDAKIQQVNDKVELRKPEPRTVDNR
jgi:hypothetical protein